MGLIKAWKDYWAFSEGRKQRAEEATKEEPAKIFEPLEPVLMNKSEQDQIAAEREEVIVRFKPNVLGDKYFYEDDYFEIHFASIHAKYEEKLNFLDYEVFQLYPIDSLRYSFERETERDSLTIDVYVKLKEAGLKKNRFEISEIISDTIKRIGSISTRGTIISEDVHEYAKALVFKFDSVKLFGTLENYRNFNFNFAFYLNMSGLENSLFRIWSRYTGLNASVIKVPYIAQHEQYFIAEIPSLLEFLPITVDRANVFAVVNDASRPMYLVLAAPKHKANCNYSQLTKRDVEEHINRHLMKIFPKEIEDGIILPVLVTSICLEN